MRVGSKEIQINETELKANDSGVSPAFLHNRKFGINSRDYTLHYKTNLIGDSPQRFPFFGDPSVSNTPAHTQLIRNLDLTQIKLFKLYPG